MQQLQEVFEQRHRLLARGRVDGLAKWRLHQLQRPAAEIIPNQSIRGHQRLAQPELRKQAFQFADGRIQPAPHPPNRERSGLGLGRVIRHLPPVHQPERIPNLVREIPSLFAQLVVERQVVARGRGQQHAHPHAVGSELLHQFDGVRAVAEALRHLPTLLVAHDAGVVNVLERRRVAVLVARDDHPRHPKEHDLRRRHKVRRGVVVADLLLAVEAVEHLDGPKPAAEPRVHHVLVLPHIVQAQPGIAALRPGGHEGLFSRFRHHVIVVPFSEIPSRNAVSPPELAADAPVLNLLHPVAVGVLELRREEPDGVVHDVGQSRFRNLRHRHEPLQREPGFNDRIGALGSPDFVRVRLDFDEVPRRFEVLDNGLPHVEPVHARVIAAVLVERAIGVEDVDGFEVVGLAEFVVVHVVGWGDLEATRSEFAVDVFVLDDGDPPTAERHLGSLAVEAGETLVVGVDTDGGVTEDGFGSCGGDDEVPSAFDLVAQVVDLALLLLVNDFLIAQRRERHWIPVHHAHAAVNQPLLVQIDERVHDPFIVLFVHREPRAVPIAARPQLLELLQDDAAVLVGPRPSVLHERVAAQIALLNALLAQSLHHLRLRCDGSVIRPGNPTGVLALHARAAHEHVLNRVVQHVPHVQHARHVGRRNDYGVRLALVGNRLEKSMFEPKAVPLRFRLCRVVGFREFHRWGLCRCAKIAHLRARKKAPPHFGSGAFIKA